MNEQYTQNIGFFKVSPELVESRKILPVLQQMGFVPWWVDRSFNSNGQLIYWYRGTSPIFDSIKIGEVVPEYEITSEETTRGLQVTAKRLDNGI